MRATWEDYKSGIKSSPPENRPEEKKVASIRDVIDRKREGEEKQKPETPPQIARNMEAIATLAGGIAHQFNNALVGITGNIELIKLDFPDHEIIEKYTESMEASVRRMTNLTSQLLAYARGGKYQPKIISLSDLVERSLSLIKHRIDPAIRVETDLQRENSLVEADPTQMQTVLSAVVANAAEAIEGSGHISIITREDVVEEELAKYYLSLKPGPYVSLIIEDDGKGMDEKTRSRVFEPFFSTKFQGRGLGMAAVYGIVKNHEGWISVHSESGKGTVISIYLPAAEVQGEVAELSKREPLWIMEDEGAVMGG